MNIREMRERLGMTQTQFANRYQIPMRSIQNWETGQRKEPEYLRRLLERQVQRDCLNHIATLPIDPFSKSRIPLPKIEDYSCAFEWISHVHSALGKKIVFALDTALMCQGLFLGRTMNNIVWVYGDNELNKYSGVIVIGPNVDERYIEEKNGIKYTNFNRTLNDALVNEDILDFQGITEALSKYYYMHEESFRDLYVEPEFSKLFEELSRGAIEYYDN